MGEKVVVEPPTIDVQYPVNGDYIKGTVRFWGNAHAYVEVKKVEVYIFEDKNNGQQAVDWKPVSLKGTKKDKIWEYEFVSTDYNSGKDGSIKMCFRVFDNSPADPVYILGLSKNENKPNPLVYIIKNRPSVIELTSPGSANHVNTDFVSKINRGGEISGQIIDRRGLAPGYPQIKIWPDDLPGGEPSDDDDTWGYASLFLVQTDNVNCYDDIQKEKLGAGGVVEQTAGPGEYMDRNEMPVVRAAQFRFRLADHILIEHPYNPELRAIQYIVQNTGPDAGKHNPYDAGKTFSFRIRTKDTASDPSNKMYPIEDPLAPPIEGKFPPVNFGYNDENPFFERPEPIKILIFSSDERPSIEINNDDIIIAGNGAWLTDKPNIYITEKNQKKIADDANSGRNVFRLRVMVSHPLGIKEVKLFYKHISNGPLETELVWNGTGGAIGVPEDYTIDGVNKKGQTYTYTASGNSIFQTSPNPYTLVVRVYSLANTDDFSDFPLYMDGAGPYVYIRPTIRGAASDPGVPPDDYYTVNGNIQALIDRNDPIGIMTYSAAAGLGEAPPAAALADAYPLVKWIVEETTVLTNTIQNKIDNFTSNPTSTNLAFFNQLVANSPAAVTPNTPPQAGWVTIPGNGESANNIKFNTNGLDGKTLWLYVIAQDTALNLGYSRVKIKVDASTDKPVAETSTLDTNNASGTAITGPNDINVIVSGGTGTNGATPSPTPWTLAGNNWSTSASSKNILQRDAGIDLAFRDDDGIDKAAGVTITLTDLNPPATATPITLTPALVNAVLKSGNEKDMSGTLSQAIMAEALYGKATGIPTHLKDGMYRIDIEVKDNAAKKVAITPSNYTGDTPVSVSSGTLTYYFAVSTELPEIVVENPAENSLQGQEPVKISGYVKTRLKVQKLWITYDPDIVTPALAPKSYAVTLYSDVARSTAITNPGLAGESPAVAPDAFGYYTYYWETTQVNFYPPGGIPGLGTGGERKFSLLAFDRLGNRSLKECKVQTDDNPPTIELIEYNHSRPADLDGKMYLYGKVPFTVSASDESGLYEKDDTGLISGYSGIKWWVFPAATAPPISTPVTKAELNTIWNTTPTVYTNGWTGGGYFTLNQADGVKYTGIIDTRKLNDGGEYKLYAIAMDSAQNKSDKLIIETFTVKQSLDNPVIDVNSLSPPQNTVSRGTLVISGTVSDGDLFDSAKQGSYVEIRVPAAVDANGVPTAWGAWIPVTDVSLDPAGAIIFKYTPAANSYFATDGTKHYQIRVTDEAVVNPASKPLNFGKNPDLFMVSNPAYPGYVYDEDKAVRMIYPIHPTSPGSETTYTNTYKFLVDAIDPIIFFNNYDPTEFGPPPGTGVPHPNYTNFRPTFSKWQDLADALKGLSGTVIEDHLSTLSFSYGDGALNKSKILLGITDPSLPYIEGTTHTWDISSATNDGTDDDWGILAPFNAAAQGPQFIVMEAIDIADRYHRVSWRFDKDTQGPDIRLANVARSIKRVSTTSPTYSIPSGTDWLPANWPGLASSNPSDWPSQDTGAIWRSDATWTAMRDNYGVGNWPSEYAYFEGTKVEIQNKIIAALTAENNRSPTIAASGADGSAAVIKGTFSDVYSAVSWKVDPGTGDRVINTFEYRFKKKDGTFLNGDTWITKAITPIGDKTKEAEWEIVLDNTGTNGFIGSDGENWVDIRVADSAGNVSYILSVRFLVDNANPELGPNNNTDLFVVYANNTSPRTSFGPLTENERVFSAAGMANDNPAYTIQGRVSDYNLEKLMIEIGQDGVNSYKVLASVDIDPLNTAPSQTPSSGYGVVGAPDDSDGLKRLKLYGPFNQGSTVGEPPSATANYTDNTTGTNPPEWIWEFTILQKDIDELRKAAGADNADSARRFLKITAIDKAKHRTAPDTPVPWYFWLDTKKPVIEYTTLEKGKYGSSFDKTVTLSGMVSDDTKIKDVQYLIGKWNYGTNQWEYNGSPTAPAVTTWPSVFTDAETPTRQTTMNWSMDQTALGEGQYRIDLYVTDFSRGDGNAHNTYLVVDPNFEDKGVFNSAPNTYNPTTGAGNASGRVFFFDSGDPTLAWRSDPGDDPDQRYYRNINGQVILKFTAGDPNTIRRWDMVIKDDQNDDWLNVSQESGGITPSGLTPPSISFTSIANQSLDIRPFMTDDRTATGIALDMIPSNTEKLPKTFTVTLSVVDGAGRSNSITKQFILDNRPPDLLNFRPGSDTLEANAGKMNVRGNTTDNSNQLKKVAFFLAKANTSGYTFPDPSTLAPADWHWHDPSDPNSFNIKLNGTTVIQIEEGTFAWELRVPQTSLFKSITNDYVQWTKTGGKTMKDPKVSVAAGTYRDVTFTYDSFMQVTGVSTDPSKTVPALEFQDLMKKAPDFTPEDKTIYGDEDVGLMTVYMLAEDLAGNVRYEALKYWIWPEGDRPQVISINNPDSTKIQAERLLNGSIRLSGMAKDNENVKYVWFRVLKTDGTPYTSLRIPKWDETTWDALPNQYQDHVDLSTIGDRRTDDPAPTQTGGWYMANGGGQKSVSWWAYINTEGELDPIGESNEIKIEVRAQDVTWDDAANGWMAYTAAYRGFASTALDVKAWVVAGAPIFDKVFVSKGTSSQADGPPETWGSIDTTNIRNRSAYRVTVKHNSGISAIRWSPTIWNKDLNSGAGGFQADSTVAPFNLLELTSAAPYVYQNASGAYVTATQAAAFAALNDPNPATRMVVTVKAREQRTGAAAPLTIGRKYLILQWDPALAAQNLTTPAGTIFAHDPNYLEAGSSTVYKDLKNTVITAKVASANLGTAVFIGAETEGTGPSAVDYFKWDVIVDVRADLLLAKMKLDDPAYGNGGAGREGQVENSVRYPVYLSATEVSKSTPLTARGDTLLPIDNLAPYAAYTLNRRPAGQAATIGGEAGDDGPVNGIAKVVLWFSRVNGGVRSHLSWHETSTAGVTTLAPVAGFRAAGTVVGGSNGEWDDSGVIQAWNTANPTKPAVTKPWIPAESAVTGGDYAIVIDRNSPSVGLERWGHKLPTGFADGGMGKYWYVEINTFGIVSGPVILHYVVIDKAGNAKYYYEPLVIMNNAPVINKIKLATDIRDNSTIRTALPNNSRVGTTTATPTGPDANGRNTILQSIWDGVPLGNTWVQKGITEDIYSSALGITKMVDFNVRNNLFALRVETTGGSGTQKERNFRLEYVSGAVLKSDAAAAGNKLTDIKAGRVYIIETPGSARWGTVGAEGDGPWPRGYAFLAAVNGVDDEGVNRFRADESGAVWELNSAYYSTGSRVLPGPLALGDVSYTAVTGGNANATMAEFVYSASAFGTTAGSSIIDYTNATDAWPPASGTHPITTAGNSMFILRVFDGPDSDLFGDFTIIRVRVNNNDKTTPYAQVYDINPKTEGQDRSNIDANEQARSLSPMFIGEGSGSNRTKGGLWNIAPNIGAVTKPGHIEPRRTTNLTSEQMGGAFDAVEAAITKPFIAEADKATRLFATDTVSGQVVLRGYVEDDQRIERVDLQIGTSTVTILNYYDNRAQNTTPGTAGYGTAGSTTTYTPPATGFLQVPANAQTTNRVHFTDTIDLYRHRVEWAYIWDTETIPGTVVGQANVRVISYNRNSAAANPASAAKVSREMALGVTTGPTAQETQTNQSVTNTGFPVGLIKYNSVNMNLRPYITGFLRNKTTFAHDTRSRQGRYMFARGETAVVTGFNLLTGANPTVITLPGNNAVTTANVATPADFGITTTDAGERNRRYRQFTVGGGAASVDGVVTLTVNNIASVNTGAERTRATGTPARPLAIMPWNIEYSPGKDGTDLWDDFTQVHIWQSQDGTGDNGGRFASTDRWTLLNPAMSIDPVTGTLYESHNESGSGFTGNSGTTRMTPITTVNTPSGNQIQNAYVVMQFVDPIFFSDVYRSPGRGNNGAGSWVASSIIGRSGQNQSWYDLGGIYVSGPGGTTVNRAGGGNGANSATGNQFNTNIYNVESTWYNSSTNNTGRVKTPSPTDQFLNPHVVTSYTNNGNSEHIHVSYYDDDTGSIKYRYNLRGAPGTIDPGNNGTNVGNNNNIPKMWTNLDGGLDEEDRDQTTYTNGAVGTGNIAQNARIVRWNNSISGTETARNNIKAGKHNAIAVTSEGFPVIAYYDQTNSRLKLAVSNKASPILAADWIIRDFVIPSTDKSSFGTGEFVSIKIDTIAGANNNRIHIAAMNNEKRLVYITGIINPNFATGNTQQTTDGVFTFDKVQVVDSVGNVGRWCSLSLDGDGNPWISYMDESYLGARDGAKVAYLNKTTFYKGVASGYFPGQFIDLYGASLEGWETMHVPTLHRVENPVEGGGREHGRLGMECLPARNYAYTGANRFWNAAVGYLSQDAEGGGQAMDRYRVAYYVK
jgi:hypothetical protein